MSKIPITVCIIAKNEERFIEECLTHLKRYDMEVIVADTGSADRTKEIAQRYADKVVDHEWTDDFSAARNYCASFASNDWILALDCDEIVHSIDVRVLQELMRRHPEQLGLLRMKNLILGADGQKGYRNDDVPRLYDKRHYQFKYSIHEQLWPRDASKDDDPIEAFLLPIDVVHHGYALDGAAMKEKQARNLRMLYKELETTPDKAYVYFQIAQSRLLLYGPEEAIGTYEKGLELIPDMERNYVPELIMSLARTYGDAGRLPDALALMDRYEPQIRTARYALTHADILWKAEEILKALGYYIKATTLPDAQELGGALASCYGRIIQVYEAFGEKEMAEDFRQRFLACNAEREQVVNRK